MTRRLVNLLTAVSLLLCVAVVELWGRSKRERTACRHVSQPLLAHDKSGEKSPVLETPPDPLIHLPIPQLLWRGRNPRGDEPDRNGATTQPIRQLLDGFGIIQIDWRPYTRGGGHGVPSPS